MNKQLIFIGLICLVSACAGRKIGTPPNLGTIAIPVQRAINYSDSSDLKSMVINYWANAKINDWGDEGKIDFKIPRAILGRLLAEKDIQETNAYLLKQFPKVLENEIGDE